MEICPRDLSELSFPNRTAGRLARSELFEELPKWIRERIEQRAVVAVNCPECRAYWEAKNQDYVGMPPDLFLQPSLVVPVVGSPGAGKTHFVMACRYTMSTTSLGPLTQGLMDITALGHEYTQLVPELFIDTRRATFMDVAEGLIERGEVVPRTNSVVTTPDSPEYLVPWHMIRLPEPFGPPAYTLTMFDVAGENWVAREQTVAGWGAGLLRGSAVMLVLNGEEQELRNARATEQFLEAYVRVLRKERSRPRSPLDLPVLVLVGRADANPTFEGLLDQVRAQDQALTLLHAGGAANPAAWMTGLSRRIWGEIEQLSEETVSTLTTAMGLQSLVHSILRTFEPGRVLFLPVSASGRPPDDPLRGWNVQGGRPLQPVGCVTALSYLLFQLGAGGRS
jgi:hypothetical protein